MQKVSILAGLLVFHATLTFGGALALPPAGNQVIKVTQPMIIGFFPPSTDKAQSDDGMIEGIAHLRFAIEDAVKCINDSGKSVETTIIVGRLLVIEQHSRRRSIRLPAQWPESVGVYLLAPGKRPRVVYAREYPSAFRSSLLPQAGKYFGAARCQIVADR